MTRTGVDPLSIGYEIRLGNLSRENRATKARRYLVEGRLEVRLVSSDAIRAVCRGNGATYELGFDESGWFCDCPSRGECAHLVALKLVTLSRPQAESNGTTAMSSSRRGEAWTTPPS